jgi:CheY-like chemotaxis protein
MAECGATALAKAGRRPYALALLDLRMPDMDGVILCEHPGGCSHAW